MIEHAITDYLRRRVPNYHVMSKADALRLDAVPCPYCLHARHDPQDCVYTCSRVADFLATNGRSGFAKVALTATCDKATRRPEHADLTLGEDSPTPCATDSECATITNTNRVEKEGETEL